MSKRSSYKKPKYFTPKVKFTPEDDAKLTAAVQELGTSDWRAVASRLEGRNPRQCRERWNNYANPEVRKDPWTAQEDSLLIEKYGELGPRWHTIASFFSARSTNQIKNRYFSIQRKSPSSGEINKIQTPESSPSVPASDADSDCDLFEKEIESINCLDQPIFERDIFSFADKSIETSPIAWVKESNSYYDNFEIFNPFFLF